MTVLGLIPARGGSKGIARKNVRPLCGKPLLQYTVEDIRREYHTEKACAPMCTVSCAHQTAYMDWWRGPQHPAAQPLPLVHPAPAPQLVHIEQGE